MTAETDRGLAERAAAAEAAVLGQTRALHEGLGKVESRWKRDGTRVTPADIALSEAIFAELRGRFPDDDFCSEETPQEGGPARLRARFAWVLDPIDGTNNYAAGIPNCAISLALLEDGLPVFGAVYDMARRALMRGGPGLGAFDGGRRVTVSGGLSGRGLVGFHSPLDGRFAGDAAAVAGRFKIRALGTSTMHLAYVAAGLFDAVVDHNVKVWDIAAAAALCLGAGGEVRFMDKAPFPLTEFDVGMARLPYYAGSAAACRELEALLGKKGGAGC
jgi:myo-inositol-1(or 4)-monophosphatase